MARMRAGRGMVARFGFSLLEVVLVLAILAVLTAIGGPRFSASSARYRADLLAQRVVADLQLAQRHAKASSASQTVTFDVSLDQYTLPNLDPIDPQQSDYTVDAAAAPYDAELNTAEFGGDATVTFDGWGLPDSGGSVTLQCASEERTVVLDPNTGEAAMQ